MTASIRLQFFVETATKHPKANFAMSGERSSAKELARLGLLVASETETGCFSLTDEGHTMARRLDQMLGKEEHVDETTR